MVTLAELHKLKEICGDFGAVISRMEGILEEMRMDIGGEYNGNT